MSFSARLMDRRFNIQKESVFGLVCCYSVLCLIPAAHGIQFRGTTFGLNFGPESNAMADDGMINFLAKGATMSLAKPNQCFEYFLS